MVEDQAGKRDPREPRRTGPLSSPKRALHSISREVIGCTVHFSRSKLHLHPPISLQSVANLQSLHFREPALSFPSTKIAMSGRRLYIGRVPADCQRKDLGKWSLRPLLVTYILLQAVSLPAPSSVTRAHVCRRAFSLQRTSSGPSVPSWKRGSCRVSLSSSTPSSR
jgi:hypothetical protein